MAVGGVVVGPGDGKEYEGRVTPFVVITCVVAATGGLIFGYDIGISGGVTSMDEFLEKFFPSVYASSKDASGHESQYCKFENHLLTLFTSSLYLAALVASFMASATTRKFGRKISMTTGGLVFLAGSVLNGAALNIEMLIIGRILLGVGIGYANQSVPVYLSEMAPPKLRGALNIGFQMAITIGIFGANLVNYGTSQMKENGWRVSLALAAAPALVMTVGAVFLPDTPSSLIERGKQEEARQMLVKIRGTSNVEDEFSKLVEASNEVEQQPLMNAILERRYIPQMVITFLIPFFQQLTGINVIMFYAPVLFKTLGFREDAALLSSVATGLVNVLATLVSIFTVDKFGRRFLFLEGGIQMMICQVSVGGLVASAFGVTGTGSFTKGSSGNLALALICIYVAAFAWSWGPLGWLVPSEIHLLETRSVGQSINVSVNMFFTFIIGQLFLSMLCYLKFGLFFFFAAWVMVMTFFVYFFIPETKNVPIEEMNKVWKDHWFWAKYIPHDAPGLDQHRRSV